MNKEMDNISNVREYRGRRRLKRVGNATDGANEGREGGRWMKTRMK